MRALWWAAVVAAHNLALRGWLAGGGRPDELDAFRARPESIAWGGGSAGGTDQILAGLIADEDWQARWYLDRIPAEINSVQGLDSWFNKLPPDKRRMLEWWGPVLTEYWGSTEGGVFTLVDSEAWLTKPGTVGKAIPTYEVFAVDADGNRLPPGEVGTLYTRNRVTDEVFEYHQAADKTAAAHLAPGTFTMGDVGHVDEDGFVFLSDRLSNMIISGGVNIYPAENEGELRRFVFVLGADRVVPATEDRPFAVQIFGSDPAVMRDAAQRCEELGAQVVAAVEILHHMHACNRAVGVIVLVGGLRGKARCGRRA